MYDGKRSTAERILYTALDKIKETKKEFLKLPAEAVSFPRSCNNMKKYYSSSDVFIKGTPIHVKGALIYNHQIKEFGLNLNDNVLVIDPIGYLEFIYLLKKSQYCISDSGTVIEEACILNIPSIQMRYSTERPEVYEVGSSIKFDPTLEEQKFQLSGLVLG